MEIFLPQMTRRITKAEMVNELQSLCTHTLDVACKLDVFCKSDPVPKDHAIQLHGVACAIHEWIDNIEDDGK